MIDRQMKFFKIGLARGDWTWFLRKRYPLAIKIEITRRCNLSCKMCPRLTFPYYSDMSLTNFTKILNQIKGVKIVEPHGYGEPLMHPNFMEMMREVSYRNMSVYLVTNGTLMTKDVSKEFLGSCEVGKITFSIDAVEEKYEEIRHGAKFGVVVKNLQDLINLKKEYSPSTIVGIASTIGSYSYNDIEKLAYLANTLNVNFLSFTDLTIYDTGLATEKETIRKQFFLKKDVIKRLKQAKKIFPKLTYSIESQSPVCLRPWIEPFIQVNGDVFVCTDNLDYKLGNVFEEHFSKIWNGKKMKKIRKDFYKQVMTGCKKCVNFPA